MPEILDLRPVSCSKSSESYRKGCWSVSGEGPEPPPLTCFCPICHSAYTDGQGNTAKKMLDKLREKA